MLTSTLFKTYESKIALGADMFVEPDERIAALENAILCVNELYAKGAISDNTYDDMKDKVDKIFQTV